MNHDAVDTEVDHEQEIKKNKGGEDIGLCISILLQPKIDKFFY